MYIYMGMFFNSQQDVPDFGSIAMYYVGTKDLGYVEEGHKRFRKYTFQSTDLNKLSLITNAIDGSEAFAVDTGTTYVLYDGQWSIKSSDLTPAKMAEILGDITSIDYQVVAALPTTGIKSTIYLVKHSHGEDDIYDEYIWVNGIYEKIGNTDVDLRNYIQKVLNANNKVSKFDSNGNLVSTGYELNKTVPADAVFTDTTYTLTQDQLDGHKMTFTPSNGNATIITIPDNNTTYEDATQSVHGLMSASDKTKLDGITISNYIPIVTGETGEVPKFKSDGTLESTGFILGKTVPSNAVFTDTTYNNATTLSAGLMSANDKTKIDNLDNTYLKKTDLVTLTEQSYEALQEKTAPYYFIIEE